MSADLEALLGASLVALVGYFLSIRYTGAFQLQDVLLLVGLLTAMTLLYDKFGVYRRHGGLRSKTLNLARAWVLSFAIIVILLYVAGYIYLFGRHHIGVLFVMGFVVQMLLQAGLEMFQRRRLGSSINDAALIVGDGWLARYICDRINANPWIPEKVVGVVRVQTDGGQDGAATVNMPVRDLGGLEDIEGILTQHKIKTVYLVTALDAASVMGKLYFTLLDRSINVHWVPDVFALSLVNFNVKELAGIPVITLSESPLSGRALLLKNIEDKVIALLALLLVSPIMFLVAFAIKIESRGPVFFLQERTGWDGKVFSIWKFRSMYVHAPEGGLIKQATSDDPRVTRVGRILRRTSIDELPQLFNVLVGNMSLVGPRPHAVQHNDLYSRQIDAYLARHRIKPGITGLAQVRGYRGETEDVGLMEERVKHDIEYINNWSLLLDISILFRTLFSLGSSRAY